MGPGSVDAGSAISAHGTEARPTLTPTHGGCGGERAGLLRMRSGRATARLWECALPVRGAHRGGGRMQRRPIESSATIQLPLQPSVLKCCAAAQLRVVRPL
jgi:hypothetical protein